MVKHNLLRWRQVKCKNKYGREVWIPLPDLLERHYRGTLLSKILGMKKGKPISWTEAIQIIVEKRREAFSSDNIGPNPGQYFWFTNNFVEYISSLGFHIELTGDEFESYSLRDHVS